MYIFCSFFPWNPNYKTNCTSPIKVQTFMPHTRQLCIMYCDWLIKAQLPNSPERRPNVSFPKDPQRVVVVVVCFILINEIGYIFSPPAEFLQTRNTKIQECSQHVGK
jgi:hypothetical protein